MAKSCRSRLCFTNMIKGHYTKLEFNKNVDNLTRIFLSILNLMISWLMLIIIATFTTAALSERIQEMEVLEGVPVGHYIGKIGENIPGIVSGPPYYIVHVPDNNSVTDFEINGSTGEIRTKIKLDRETHYKYSFVAVPSSGENIRVIINVLDENDNAPTFPHDVMNIEFPENTPRDVKHTLKPAKDADLGRYNTQRYNIISGNVNNAFRLSPHRESDGVLYLDLQINGFLDRETIPAYSLVIEALDGGNPPLRGYMTVNITIQDVNDNQPIFNQSRYFATIPENSTVGTSVLQVYASDTDANENGLVEYSINRRQSDKIQMFRIDPLTGLISVNKPLDFETKELHELVVVAKDHGEQPLETTAFVSIRVTDVNDNQPTINVIFLSDDATPKISESAQPGEFVARISVNDPDSKTEYSNVNVTLTGGDGRFGLTTRDNIIYLVIVSLPLDRESTPNYTLSVIATDNGNPPLHASKTIYLRVMDINDNPPEFEKTVYLANVMEVADPGTSVIQVVAVDKDEGNNSAVSYSLIDTPDTHSQWFQIDSSSGLITTRSHIDCETEPVPKLTVVAEDSGKPPLSSTATVLVTIHDVNDNEPIFDQSFYNVSVAENEAIGRCILKVSASDPDCGVNAMVNYTFGEGIKMITKFEVKTKTGEICISDNLDYEYRNSYEFPVIATDRGGLSTTAMVKIQLTDINDNRPVFYPREYNVSLRESSGILTSTSTPVVSVVATDPDSGRFGSVSYRIAAGNENGIFRIDRLSGEIFINNPNMLSRRSQPKYLLNISATDGGGLRSSQDALIYISIIDATQRPPIFENSRYNYKVKEDMPRGTIVGAVSASSSDTAALYYDEKLRRQLYAHGHINVPVQLAELGSRNIIRYSIYSGDPDGYFSIDPTTGNIRIANLLDHETKPQVLLNVLATCGDPPAYGHTQVNVDIEDVNDNAPEFESNMVRISVPENASLGTPIYSANAHDKDSGKSGIITYSITKIGSTINDAIGNSSYISSLAPNSFLNSQHKDSSNLKQFQGETGGSYFLNKGFPLQYGTTKSISAVSSTQFMNNLKNSESPSITINSLNLFSIDSHSGHISLSRHLDYETSQRHSLIVTATDSGVPQLSANLTVLVEVQDVNDNAPQFERSEYSIRVLESMPINSQILQVTAVDIDTGNNARLTYRIVGSNQILSNLNINVQTLRKQDNLYGKLSSELNSKINLNDQNKESSGENNGPETKNVFGIFPNSGWIYLRRKLDRETCDRFELTVMASDNGSPSANATTRVIVNILDTNDNDPQFSQELYEFSIDENMIRGSVVGKVFAFDLDLDVNAAVRYSLIPSNTSLQINSLTGEITTREPLDRESKSVYDLLVEAKDQGSPYRSTRVPIKVHVNDINDNAPEIVDPQEDVVSVREEQLPGTEVVKIRAVDRDNGNNSTINYSILKSRDSDGFGLFTIDSKSGLIRTSVVLDHEERSIYRLAIAATDNGNPPKQTIRMLRIEVLDLNDNRPTFTSSSLVFRVREDVPVGFVIGPVGPDRSDSDNTIVPITNLHVTYTLSSLNKDSIEGAFDMDSQTGSLIVARKLDRETQSEYRLEIRALDTTTSSNPQSSSVIVKVEIADVNDNAPQWPTDPIKIFVDENTPVGNILYNFTATDADTGSNGELLYELLRYCPQSDNKTFAVDAITGSLTLQAQLDYEEINEYILIVLAKDQSSNKTERLRTSVTVHILVKDVNDNDPIFILPVLTIEISNRKGVEGNITRGKIILSDSIGIGQVVTHIIAADKDSGDNGKITYSIIEGNKEEIFKIDSSTGIIKLSKSLQINPPPYNVNDELIYNVNENSNYSVSFHSNYNYEREKVNNFKIISKENHESMNEKLKVTQKRNGNFNLIISASDNGKPSRKVQLHLDIVINSVTNIPPRFFQSVYYINISEITPIGSILTRVGAKSFSSNENSNLLYEIPHGIYDNHFQIGLFSGIVTNLKKFDREVKDEYTIPIYVMESITNKNISSNGTFSPTASDLHSLALTHQSKGQFDIATVNIRITDINDNAPEFRPGSCYPLLVPENSETTVIHTVVATDMDSGINSEILYSIIGGNLGNKFSIDSHSGELTARSLDREQHSRYVLQIQAQDRGTPISYQGYCNISVMVGDQNDNDPIFEQTKYTVNIPENIDIGNSVLKVRAHDADSGENSRITYSLANETQLLFVIDIKTGLISTVGALDRENQNSFNFMVVATDGGKYDSRSRQVPVQIFIEDVNDNKPVFEFYPFRANVAALIQPGQTIVQVNAIDIDQGINGEIFYNIINDSTEGKFRINANTGAVSAAQSLSSEIGNTVHLEIMARDKGNPQQSSIGLVEIRVGELQPGTPNLRFQNDSYSIKLRENSKIGQTVLHVGAVRSDGRRQKIIYSFGAGNEDGSFSIDANNGEIKVRKMDNLDFERNVLSYSEAENYRNGLFNTSDSKFDNIMMSKQIKLVIVANTDSLPMLYGYAELNIELEDENDNDPHFTQTQYSAIAWEGKTKGTFVTQVKALDADAPGPNSRILYHIVDGNHDNAFIIEPAFSGIVKTNIVLDREIRDLYRLKVIATDEGIPQMTGTTIIHVRVIDINDNQPTFPPTRIINVSEGTELGTLITTVSANDVDTNPVLTYQFSENTDAFDMDYRKFSIDRYSGKVILQQKLDAEVKQEYQLEIIASDSLHKVSTILTVRVTDENDNAPIFQRTAYITTYSELNTPASIAARNDENVNSCGSSSDANGSEKEIISVNATDADKSEKNSKIRYQISPHVPGFSINEWLGTICINSSYFKNKSVLPSSSPTLLNKNSIYLNILATDSGQKPLTSSASVKIILNKSSSGLTQFLQSQYRTSINENAYIGTTVFKLNKNIIQETSSLLDDSQINLKFAIVSGNEDGAFEVFQSSAIILVKKLDREKNDLYKLKLIMSEDIDSEFGGDFDNLSSIDVFLTVEDDNDNHPVFELSQKYFAEISELAPLRYSIATLKATDADQENTPSSDIVYDIASGNDAGMFTIDLVTGVLFVNNKLDYDKGNIDYNLTIRACDSAVIPKCALQSFRIKLVDENDNEPKFPLTEYMEFVEENEPIGTSIFTIRATDMDRGPYGILNYTIEPLTYSSTEDISKLFKVDRSSGVVTTNMIFDYEQRSRYSFTLKATDIGGKYASVKVNIIIDSRDEFSPQFTERTYRFIMASPGLLPIGYIIGQVMATDRDKGIDGRIVYQLSSQHPYFKVNRTTGAILVKKKIDNNFDIGHDVSLVVTASSGRQGSLTNMTVVEISIDPLSNLSTNLASSGVSSSSGMADWAIGLLISFLLIIFAFAAVFFFLHMRNRRPKSITKPNLSTETVGNSNSYVDPSAFDTLGIRSGGNGNNGNNSNTNQSTNSSQFAPPKYDEIPPYGPHTASSNSGAATTSELSGSEQSGSSGRGSAEEGDDGEDEEIRMINEGPMIRNAGSEHLHNGNGRLSDISVQNTQEYLARLGIVDTGNNGPGCASMSSRHGSESLVGSNKETLMHQLQPVERMHHGMYDSESNETDLTNLIYAKLNEVTGSGSDRAISSTDDVTTAGSTIGPRVDHVLSYSDVAPSVVGSSSVNNHHPPGPSMTGSLSSIIHSEEELTGSYNWDYLLDWGPQYQPLAHVFSEIARLKDDQMSVHSGNSGASSSAKSVKSKQSIQAHPLKHIPPPLLTNIAPRSINVPVLSSRGSHISTSSVSNSINNGISNNNNNNNSNSHQYHLPRSSISHDGHETGFTTSSAMSPSFSPSLSPLANRSPTLSQRVVNTHLPQPGHHLVSLPRHHPQSQLSQRKNLDADLRVRL